MSNSTQTNIADHTSNQKPLLQKTLNIGSNWTWKWQPLINTNRAKQITDVIHYVQQFTFQHHSLIATVFHYWLTY